MKMNLRKIKCIAFTLLCLMVTSMTAKADEPSPRWVRKDVKELNDKRSNETYRFHVFHMFDADKMTFEMDRFKPLLEYIHTTFNVEEVTLDRLPAVGSQLETQMLSFDYEGMPIVMYAQLVDEYVKFEEYADSSFEYNLYQLYAISEPNISPVFDDFTLNRRYKGAAVAMSIIPGLGQIYKGQTSKGYTIMGAEALLIGGMIYTSIEMNNRIKLRDENPEYYASYQSNVDTFKQLRMFCAIAGAGLYVYNLLDAALVKGARYVEIKRKDTPAMELSFAPMVMPTGATGVGVNLKF